MNGLDKTFCGKSVLVTGHTGFKGSWLCIWLEKLGAQVIGYALEPLTAADNFAVTGMQKRMVHIVGDIRDYEKLRRAFAAHRPEYVFHLAAQPIVRQSYLRPKETYDVNVGGTVNLLECCRTTDSVRVIVNVTSDKCYENRESIWGYRETDPMGGFDPYSSSKGCAELVTAAFADSFFGSGNSQRGAKGLASVRAGNVIGGGDWQVDRIVPDCIRALEQDKPIELRDPSAVRPWQHVLDPLSGYLCLAREMDRQPEKRWGGWNFGPAAASAVPVSELVTKVVRYWGGGSWRLRGQPGDGNLHEAKTLRLDTTKAAAYLGWQPTWGLDQSVDRTVEWYRNYRNGDAYAMCRRQIEAFEAQFNHTGRSQ